jgi:hypothetical protein
LAALTTLTAPLIAKQGGWEGLFEFYNMVLLIDPGSEALLHGAAGTAPWLPSLLTNSATDDALHSAHSNQLID